MCSSCHSRDGVWQCLNCLGKPLHCTQCCRDVHRLLPFHRVQQWVGSHFAPSWLRQVGVIIHLGHGGNSCPAPPAKDHSAEVDEGLQWETSTEDGLDDIGMEGLHEPIPIVDLDEADDIQFLLVIDTSGVHSIGFQFCSCPNSAPHDIQLVDMGFILVFFKKVKIVF